MTVISDFKGAAAAHRMRAIDEQILEDDLEEVWVGQDRRRCPIDRDIHLLKGRIATEQIGDALHEAGKFDWRGLGLRRPREQQEILHQLVEPVDARHDLFGDDAGLHAVWRQSRADDLNRATDPGQRILDFVGQHRGHFTKPGQGVLFAQLLLDAHPRASGRAEYR